MAINMSEINKGGATNTFVKFLMERNFKVEEATSTSIFDSENTCFYAEIEDDCGNRLSVYFSGNYSKITARVDKINGTHKWYRGKTLAQMMAIVRQCMEGHTFPEPKTETKEEEDTMESTEIELTTPKTFEREGGRSAVTITGLWRQCPTDNWTLVDDDHTTWYRKPEWDEDGKIAYYMPDSVKGQRILVTEQELNNMINNEEEETTMKTTNTFTLLNGTTYTAHPDTKRYSKTTADGKTKRISYVEYNGAKFEYDKEQEVENLELHPEDAQAELDKDPCRVEVNSDLYKPAVFRKDCPGCVDCSECNVTGCVHRDCMRRNPRSEGGLGECPRLDVKPQQEEPDEVQDPELEQIMEETGLEASDAELERNIRNEQKKPRKARKSKDIAYEGHGKTLTAKQVDFLQELVNTDGWDGFDSPMWTDVLCDEIEGQFAGKPMTVGAMISTLCEKGLAERSKGDFTDPVTGRTRKSTYMAFTGLGQEIAEELGL